MNIVMSLSRLLGYVFLPLFSLTIDRIGGTVWENYLFSKSYDEERTGRVALQRADGWCESVCRTYDPLPSEPETPKVHHPVDVSRVCYVSA